MAVSLVATFTIGQISTSFAYDNLAASLATDPDINPDRSKPVQNDIAERLKPGAIGNGIPLIELAQGKLPPRVTLQQRGFVITASKLREAISVAVRLSIANKSNVPREHEERFQKAQSNLIDLQNRLEERAYLYNADIRTQEDYLLGFNFNAYIGLSLELIDRLYSVSSKRLAQYIFHECVPEKGIITEREDHRIVYNEIQSAIFGQDEVAALKKDLRGFTNERIMETRAIRSSGPEGPLVLASGAILPKASQVMVSASILSVPDAVLFAQKSMEAIRAGADFIHFDVVEGKKGKNALLEENSIDTTEIFTPEKLAEIKREGRKMGMAIPIDVHLVVVEPSEDYIKQLIDAGANYISLHWEAFRDKNRLLARLKFIKKHGSRAGIALRPDVDIQAVGKFITGIGIPYIDMIAQTTIYPCYEGQAFVYSALNNIYILRQNFKFKGPIAVDGGVESELASKKAIEAGANFIIAGSAFFGNGFRTFEGMKVAAKSLRDQGPIPYGSIYDIIADKILQQRRSKKGKIWVRIMGYHSSGKSVVTQGVVESLRAKDASLSIIDFSQDDFWSDREERKRRKAHGDPTYKNGLTHLRISDLNRAIETIEKASEQVTFNNIYDFDSGAINAVRTHNIREDSIVIVEGCYLGAVTKQDFDLTVYIETNIQQAKERAMNRDSIKVHRKSTETKWLYAEVYEPTYRNYLKWYKPKESADIVLDTTIIDKPRIVDSRRPLKLLECTVCHKQFTAETRISRCAFCGGDLEFDIKGPVDFEKSIIKNDKSMWRYRKLFPVEKNAIVTAGEGNTPVVYLEDISRELGIELYVKLETANPTGTFKDREASFVVSRSKQLGQNDIVMQSTGNTGVAISYYAGLAGMRSYFFGPLLSQYKLLMPEKKNTAKIILVDGEPVDIKTAATDFALIHNFPKISPFYERCEANTTQGYELAEEILEGKAPNFDFYVQTIAAGMGPIGFFAGMERVSRWTNGKVKIPRIVAVQISEFAPVQEAWEEDREQVGAKGFTPIFASEHPFEPTLHTTNAPLYYPFLRRLLKSSNGILTRVEPRDVLTEKERLKDSLRSHGIELTTTENSSFVAYAGLIQQMENGSIPRGSKVIMMVTGKGAKKYIKAEPDAVIELSYDSERLLRDLRTDNLAGSAPQRAVGMKKLPTELKAEISEDLPVRAKVFAANLTKMLTRHPDQLFFIGVETDIGKAQKAQVMPIYKAVDEIRDMKDAKGGPLFPNLMVKREKAEGLTKMVRNLNEEGRLNLNNAFIGARKVSVDNKLYDDIKGEGKAWIAAIDDSKPGDYLPVFEAITLNVMGYLNADLTAIKNFYDAISKEPIDIETLQGMLKNRIIYILPKATAFDAKQLRDLYELAHQVYIAA